MHVYAFFGQTKIEKGTEKAERWGMDALYLFVCQTGTETTQAKHWKKYTEQPALPEVELAYEIQTIIDVKEAAEMRATRNVEAVVELEVLKPQLKSKC